jgi:hypothetical protein
MEQTPPPFESQPGVPQPTTMSLAGRLLNVFADPGSVFDEVKASAPSVANWLAPALILILVGWVGAWLVFSQETVNQQLREITDQAIQKQIEKRHVSEADADRMREAGAKFGAIGTKISAVAGSVVVAFVTPFWGGLIIWLVGAKAFKGQFSYMKAVEVAGLTNTIGILDSILKTLLIVTLGNLYASPSLMLLVKGFNPQNPLHGLLLAVNVMTFWIIVVRSIGLARLSGASFGKAAAWLFGIWAGLTGLGIGFSAAIQAISAR